jgi:hypothetical protein
MNYSLADILGIIVDGTTIVYVGYKAGRWVLNNREKLIRRGQHLRVTITNRLRTSDSHTQALTGGAIPSLASAGGGTLLQGAAMASTRVSSSALGTLSFLHPQEKPPAWEELLWWYLRVR